MKGSGRVPRVLVPLSIPRSRGQSMEISRMQATGLAVRRRPAKRDWFVNEGAADPYGDIVVALARKITESTEEADAAAIEIFADIGRYADNTFETPTPEYLRS